MIEHLPTLEELDAAEHDPALAEALIRRTTEGFSSYARDNSAAPGAGPKAGRRKRHDWALAARLLAQGMRVEAVAERIGCNRTSLWRAMRRSPGLRHQIERHMQEAEGQARGLLLGQKDRIVDALLTCAVEDRNAHVLFRLVKEFGLFQYRGYMHPNAHGLVHWPLGTKR